MSAMRVELLLHFSPTNLRNPATLTKSRLKVKAITPPSDSSRSTGARIIAKPAAATSSSSPKSKAIIPLILKEHSRTVLLVGVAAVLLMDESSRALALGPEGPLMEEFWDNMRRYALYALTVSTGALYILLEPIIELMKNPISAVLIVLILGGGFYLVSQIVNAMVGLSDFTYDYSNY